MAAKTLRTHPWSAWTITSVDLHEPDSTLTLAEWHRSRDTEAEISIVVPHEPQPLAA